MARREEADGAFTVRFSIRAWLVLSTSCAILLGWHVSPGQKQRRVAKALREAGALVLCDSDVPITSGPIPEFMDELCRVCPRGKWRVQFGSAASDERLRLVGSLGDVRELDVYFSNVTDRGLCRISTLKQLRTLNLAGTRITDIGLRHLAKLRELRSVNLSATNISDAGIEVVGTWTHLEELNLSYTGVGDGAAGQCRALPKLNRLDMAYTCLGDAGLEQLEGTRAITELDATGRGVEARSQCFPYSTTVDAQRPTQVGPTPTQVVGARVIRKNVGRRVQTSSGTGRVLRGVSKVTWFGPRDWRDEVFPGSWVGTRKTGIQILASSASR